MGGCGCGEGGGGTEIDWSKPCEPHGCVSYISACVCVGAWVGAASAVSL